MRRFAAYLVLMVPFFAAPLHAQSAQQRLRDLFHFGTCDTLVCLNVGTMSTAHGTHFNGDAAITLTTLINLLTSGISTSVDNVPLGGTSSGVTITFDQNGLPVATHGSSGSIFGERAQTLGRGRALFGVNVTSSKFEKLRGVRLSDLNSTLTHEDVPPPGLGNPAYEFDTLHVHTRLNATLATYTAFLTYGVSNRVDIGIAIPVVQFSFSGTSVGQIFNTYGGNLHYFRLDSAGNPVLIDTTRSSSTTTGIGDIALRTKINLAQTARGGAALFADVRLPTGSAADLLGTGSVSARALAVVSGRFGPISPHINAGYLYRTGADDNDAALATIGFDALIVRNVTVAADLLGQWQVGASKIALPPPVTYIDGSVVRRTTLPNMRDNILDGSIGAKFAIGPVFTGIANVIVPFTSAGLEPNVTWTIGGELNFGVKFSK